MPYGVFCIIDICAPTILPPSQHSTHVVPPRTFAKNNLSHPRLRTPPCLLRTLGWVSFDYPHTLRSPAPFTPFKYYSLDIQRGILVPVYKTVQIHTVVMIRTLSKPTRMRITYVCLPHNSSPIVKYFTTMFPHAKPVQAGRPCIESV